jgi:hypothetical protein
MTERFREVTDRLLRSITLADLAQDLGVSHGLLRQARLDPNSSSYRSPPHGWLHGAARLARERASELSSLAEELEAEARPE